MRDSLFCVPADRLLPAGDAVVCLFQEPNTRLPASLEKCYTVARKNVGNCRKHKCPVNGGVLLPMWVSQPGGVSEVTCVCQGEYNLWQRLTLSRVCVVMGLFLWEGVFLFSPHLRLLAT